MKWIIIVLNVVALVVAGGLRQGARSFPQHSAEDAYQGLVSRELLNQTNVEAYARAHNGWHARDRLYSIADLGSSFAGELFYVVVFLCVMNSVAVLLLARKKGTHAAS
jgi:hypothetical protein